MFLVQVIYRSDSNDILEYSDIKDDFKTAEEAAQDYIDDNLPDDYCNYYITIYKIEPGYTKTYDLAIKLEEI